MRSTRAGAFRLTAPLLPVSQRADVDPEEFGELGLREAKPPSKRRDIDIAAREEDSPRSHFASEDCPALLHAFHQFVEENFTHGTFLTELALGKSR